MRKIRVEKDSLGQVTVPIDAYYGAQTVRAIRNFPISHLKPDPKYTCAVVIIKKAAALVNHQLGLLDAKKSQTITSACDEILKGKFPDQFLVDPYQAGAGTSHHMNINEVIANRANELLGAPLGSYQYIHPNDHVNMSQSTNDVIPTAIRISCLTLLPELLKTLNLLISSFFQKSKQFSKIIKSGRTHLQDALPITLGQEFSAYGKAIEEDTKRIKNSFQNLLKIGIGGTAVGTGTNSHPRYQKMMISQLSLLTHLQLKSSDNLFESMQNTADFLEVSSALRSLSQNLIRISNDLRLLSSGPQTGFQEINIPPVQPGSSIMPGKINPSIVEMLTMVCFQITGMDQTIFLASQAGQLELNVMLPLISYNLLQQIKLLTNALNVFRKKCILGIIANEKMCLFWFERSNGIATILNPHLGYDKTAELVKLSLSAHKSIKEVILEKGYLSRTKLKKMFSNDNLTKPNLTHKT